MSIVLPFVATTSVPDRSPCTFVPGSAIGSSEILLADRDWSKGMQHHHTTPWDEMSCAHAVLFHHPSANGVRLHGDPSTVRQCSAVYGMRDLVAWHAPVQSCYLYPSSAAKTVCTAAPAACTGVHVYPSLDIGASALNGAVPTQLGLLHDTLESLDLSENTVSGTVPSQLGRLTRLHTLRMNANLLSGSLPSELGRLTRLAQLWVHANRLSGHIPAQLGALNPTQCLLKNGQLTRSEAGSSTTAADDDVDDNRFACPRPPLSTSCGLHGVAYAGRDGHHTGAACAAPVAYSAYHALDTRAHESCVGADCQRKESGGRTSTEW